MPKLNLNLQFLFTEYEVKERYKKAAELGFKFVELQNPYGIDVNELQALLDDLGLEQILINIDVSDKELKSMNLALNPLKRDKFKERVEKSVKYAETLSVRVVNCTPGPALDDFEYTEQYETLVENLRYASPLFEASNTKLLMEPINTFDQPGFFINKSKDGAKLVEDVGHNNMGLQYDIYHMQLMEGNLINNIKQYIDIIGHFQIADVPGRFEPGKGEIGYSNLFNFIDDIGYDGFIGAEYNPETDTESGLSWINNYNGLIIG